MLVLIRRWGILPIELVGLRTEAGGAGLPTVPPRVRPLPVLAVGILVLPVALRPVLPLPVLVTPVPPAAPLPVPPLRVALPPVPGPVPLLKDNGPNRTETHLPPKDQEITTLNIFYLQNP
eukprot:TRINITY_DN7882_c0_g1_i1.p2 TRINITY_DN7882_c0_g1~~TRINITY_DN7882_c0_g1_i1.p2  ORF type:complete len:120 (+),score=2.97 TRINITY_DN7882_c0_g1_i1:375-734(+)